VRPGIAGWTNVSRATESRPSLCAASVDAAIRVAELFGKEIARPESDQARIRRAQSIGRDGRDHLRDGRIGGRHDRVARFEP
jgi:hypothetical protein